VVLPEEIGQKEEAGGDEGHSGNGAVLGADEAIGAWG